MPLTILYALNVHCALINGACASMPSQSCVCISEDDRKFGAAAAAAAPEMDQTAHAKRRTALLLLN